MVVKMSESELLKVSSDTNTQMQNVQKVIQQLNAAVTGTDWRSQAADSYKSRWGQDKSTLDALVRELEAWSRKCKDHAAVANRVNRPVPSG